MTTEKICFVISPIGEEGSDIRRYFDSVLNELLTPVLEQHGYIPKRADHLGEPGIITTQVIKYLQESALVIADLSRHNPNVFYELAVRHAVGLPVIQIITKDETIPFDAAAIRTISYDLGNIKSIRQADRELANQIKAIEENPGSVETPLSVANLRISLQASENPLENSVAEILQRLSGLENQTRLVERSIQGGIWGGVAETVDSSPMARRKHKLEKEYFDVLLYLDELKAKNDDESALDILGLESFAEDMSNELEAINTALLSREYEAYKLRRQIRKKSGLNFEIDIGDERPEKASET